MRRLLIFLLLTFPACAEWSLSLLGQDGERAVGSSCDMGSTVIGEEIAAAFRLRNLGETAAPGSIVVQGTDFLPIDRNPPAMLGRGEFFEFVVRFRPRAPGSFSAALAGPHGAVILRAAARPAVTVQNGAGLFLGIQAPLDFGAVEIGLSRSASVVVGNFTSIALSVPAATITGPEFTVHGVLPEELTPGQSVSLEVTFAPEGRGERLAFLSIGERQIPLRGEGLQPPLPAVSLLTDLTVRSGEQHEVRIRFDEPLRTAASGELAMEAEAAGDDTLVFANGTRTAGFDLKPGDQERSLSYQTGATAGAIRFRLRIGERTDEVTVQAAEEPVRVTNASGARDASSVTLRLIALDNTCSTALLTYTFFDRQGREVGRWSGDYAASFVNYFKESRIGGVYSLHTRFPVTGDPSQVHSARVELTNRTGASRTDSILF